MSTPDNMSNQQALLRANSPVNASDGFWYSKEKITGPEVAKQASEKSISRQKPTSLDTNEIRNSLFHVQCGCSKCKNFDLAKLAHKKVSNLSYAEVLSSKGNTDSKKKENTFYTKMNRPPPFSSAGNKAKAQFHRDERVLKE